MGKLTHWAVVFAMFAALYALLAVSGVAGNATPIANILFWTTSVIATTAFIGSILSRH